MKTIIVHLMDSDGYVLGAAEKTETNGGERYWHPDGEYEEGCAQETWSVDPGVAEMMLVHGTSDQWFGDGYEAYSFLTHHPDSVRIDI